MKISVAETRECPNTDFRCNSTGRCIPLTWACDGEDDCSDGSDESLEIGCLRVNNSACLPYQYQCVNHRCIEMVSFGMNLRKCVC